MKAFAIIYFPHDEYGSEKRCTGAGRESLHAYSQGNVMAAACENVRNWGCRPCALFEHSAEVQSLAESILHAEKGKGRVTRRSPSPSLRDALWLGS